MGGALYWNDFINLAKAAGFDDPRLVEDSRITISNKKVEAVVGHLRFFSATYRLFKLPGGVLESDCEDYGQAVRYKARFRSHPTPWCSTATTASRRARWRWCAATPWPCFNRRASPRTLTSLATAPPTTASFPTAARESLSPAPRRPPRPVHHQAAAAASSPGWDDAPARGIQGEGSLFRTRHAKGGQHLTLFVQK